MPLYEYSCPKCFTKFDKIVLKHDEVVICECGEVAKKMPSLSNFHLKGSGWAKDGYTSKKRS